jgi:hypothetical protein
LLQSSTLHWSEPYTRSAIFFGQASIGDSRKTTSPWTGASTTWIIRTSEPMEIFGLNVLGYLYHVRIFYKTFRARLALLPELDFSFSSTERDFIEALLAAFDEAIPKDHFLLYAESTARVLYGWYSELSDLAPSTKVTLEKMVTAATQWRMEQKFLSHVEFKLEHFELGKGTFAGLGGSAPQAHELDEARFLNSLLFELEAINDRDQLFAKLQETQATLCTYVKPLAP